MKKCPYCSKEFPNRGIATHIWRNHTKEGQKFDPNRGYKDGSRIAWNKGLTKETDVRILNHSLHMSKILKGRPGHPISEKTKKILSIKACERVKNSPYSKHYNYNGVILESSYEYRFALILDELNIKWTKDRSIWFEWEDQKSNRIRRYTPDFYLPDYNIYIDTKNDYLIKKDSYKIKQVIKGNNINLIILSNEEINKTKIQQMNKSWTTYI